MDLLIKKIKEKGYKRKYYLEYELWNDRKQSLFRKTQLLNLDFIVSVEIIPIELMPDIIK